LDKKLFGSNVNQIENDSAENEIEPDMIGPSGQFAKYPKPSIDKHPDRPKKLLRSRADITLTDTPATQMTMTDSLYK